jgi:hypothetical protein
VYIGFTERFSRTNNGNPLPTQMRKKRGSRRRGGSIISNTDEFVIFDIGEYIIMEWTIPNESRVCRIWRRVLIRKVLGTSCC